jgi:hypothetical protein
MKGPYRIAEYATVSHYNTNCGTIASLVNGGWKDGTNCPANRYKSEEMFDHLD